MERYVKGTPLHGDRSLNFSSGHTGLRPMLCFGGGYWSSVRWCLRQICTCSCVCQTTQTYQSDLFEHILIWQVSPQLSCGNTCQMWTWYTRSRVSLKPQKTGKLTNVSIVSVTPTPSPLDGDKDEYVGGYVGHHDPPDKLDRKNIMWWNKYLWAYQESSMSVGYFRSSGLRIQVYI